MDAHLFILKVSLYHQHQAGKSYYQLGKENSLDQRKVKRWIEEAKGYDLALNRKVKV